jgi:hypothetical protein
MDRNRKRIINSDDFFNFVIREFKSAEEVASLEELAIFACGSLEDAIEEYKSQKGEGS